MLISFLNMVLLFLGGTYWRKKVKWYRSLLDVFLLIIVQLIGVYASRAYRTTPLDYLDAVVVEGLTLGFILCGIFAVVRLLRRSR
jgi:SNF family Na+-dependent transporter